MKKIAAILIFLFTAFTPVSYALSELDNAVEESENTRESTGKKHKTTVKTKKKHKHNEEDNELGDTLFKLICLCWFINQADTKYDDYPYENGNWYLENSFTKDKTGYCDDEKPFQGNRLYRFSLGTSFLDYPNLGYGNETKFESMLCPFIGLSCTNTFLTDNGDQSGIININGILPIFQFNKLSMYMDFGWQRWYGDAHEVLKRNSFLYGLEFKSYPFDPLVLEYQITWQYASENTTLQQMGIHAGIMAMGNKEFYGEYKRISIDHESKYSDGYTVGSWNGFSLGAKIYF